MSLTRRNFLKSLAAAATVGMTVVGTKPEIKKGPDPVVSSDSTVKWRRYSSLPGSTSPLCEGIVPTGNRLKVEWV